MIVATREDRPDGTMDGDHTHGDQHIRLPLANAATLTVRAWLEPRPDGPPRLRGTVQVLGGPMLGAFDSLERLVELISTHAPAGPAPSILIQSEDDDA
jgi:hypothetical protein